MLTIKKITEDLDLYRSFWQLTQTYEDVCTTKIESIRKSIFGARTYIDGLYEVFAELRRSTTEPLQLAGLGHVLVLLSSNRRFSGQISHLVFAEFLKAWKQDPGAQIIVVGKIGRQMVVKLGDQIKYAYFEVPEENVALADLQPIFAEIQKYQTVDVFYGRFINLVKQLPLQYNLAGNAAAVAAAGATSNEPQNSYLFEPSLAKIQKFFETELLTSFFRQNINESHMANLGSRAMKMEESSVSISQNLRSLTQTLRIASRDQENRKRLNMLPAVFYGNFS